MKKKFRVKGNEINFETTVPAKTLLSLDVELKESDHGRGKVEVLILNEFYETILHSSFESDKIAIIGKEDKVLFTGLIEKVEFQIENNYVKAVIYCISNTILMDRKEKRRSFQNSQMTYRQIMNQVINKYDNSWLIWQAESDCAIKYPIIQYDETDWEFLKRLASHFNTVMYSKSQMPNLTVCLGVGKGKIQNQIEDRHIVFSNYGISEHYYTEGGFEEGRNREEALYLEVAYKDEWDIGDIILWEGDKYIVYRKRIIFAKGEVSYSYLLGKEYFLYRRKRINRKMSGVSIKGEVKKAEKENVYLQLEIDEAENAQYPWNWAPETGNLCYCMPEKGTKVVLYFASGNEKDAIALHALRTNSDNGVFSDIQNRGVHTKADKRMALYPEQLFIEGKGKLSGIYLDDKKGIQFKSSKELVFNAAGGVYINGKKEIFSALTDVVCRTKQSNIELNRDINLYAPKGVQTNGKKDSRGSRPMSASIENKADHWQIAYSAMAAVPEVIFDQIDDDGIVDFMAKAAIPKIATGKTTLAMVDVMKGVSEAEAKYSNALRAMELYTVKGGYPLPKEEK